MQGLFLFLLAVYGFIITVIVLFIAIMLVYNTKVQDNFIDQSTKIKEKVKHPFEKKKEKVYKCPKCEKVIDKDDLYCRYCGKKIAKEKA